ncbi:MAG: hypothetical protein MHMPM18_003166, partial [Marteilia pararefringens]
SLCSQIYSKCVDHKFLEALHTFKTTGIIYNNVNLNGKQIQLVDFAGDPSFRDVWFNLSSTASVIFFLFDMSLQLSDNREINRKMIESFEVFSKIYENEDYYKKQFVLIGNKCDEL